LNVNPLTDKQHLSALPIVKCWLFKLFAFYILFWAQKDQQVCCSSNGEQASGQAVCQLIALHPKLNIESELK